MVLNLINGEIAEKSIAFMLNQDVITARTLYKILIMIKEHEDKSPGLKSVKNLIGDNTHIATSEIDKNIVLKDFDKIARKYGIKFAVHGKQAILLPHPGTSARFHQSLFQENGM